MTVELVGGSAKKASFVAGAPSSSYLSSLFFPDFHNPLMHLLRRLDLLTLNILRGTNTLLGPLKFRTRSLPWEYEV